MKSLIGQTLGKYEIIELIGQGGMATVYKGYQKDIDRYVAIKVLPPHPAQDAQFVERFQLEARTIARLQHPHILPLYDYGSQDDILYLAMAYVQGGSLSDRLDSGAMKLADIEKLLHQVAAALDYAHRQGIIHRDIKPDNILIDGEGYALLADFGIAKLIEGDSRLTGTGGLVGTPAYMAPEQAQGLPVTGALDIYSLGVVVYEMITGKQPYTAETPMQIVIKHMTDPVPNIRTVSENLPPALEVVMLRVLAKEPQDRYATATAFAQDFSGAIHGAESLAGAQIGLREAEKTSVKPDHNEANTLNFDVPQAGGAQTTQTALAQPSNSPLLLVGGGIIALLVVVIVVLALLTLNSDNRIVVINNPTATESTAPTEVAAVAPTLPPSNSLGVLSFSSVDLLGDTANLRVDKLAPTAQGQKYAVWLRNTDTGETLGLGSLSVDALGGGLLTHTDAEGRMLPGSFNAVLITLEERESDTPNGDIAYSGSVPVEVMKALRTILVKAETPASPPTASAPVDSMGDMGSTQYADVPVPGDISLLDGALQEADFAALHAGLAAGATNVPGMQTHAEHTINILQGLEEDYNGNGRGENPSGLKLGVAFFLDRIEARLDAALSAPGISRRVQADAELIRVCIQNSRLRTDQIIEREQALIAAESVDAVEAQLQESTQLTTELISGADLNGNGQVEPFEGECGLEQIRAFGVLVGSIDIVAGNLSE